MHDTLDDLLNGAAPPVSLHTPDAEAAIAEMVTDAQAQARRGRGWAAARRTGGAAVVLGHMAVGTAAAAGVLPFPSSSGGSPERATGARAARSPTTPPSTTA